MLPWCEVKGNSWTGRLDAIGIPTLPNESASVVKKGDAVVAFCTPKFFNHAVEIRRRKATMIWIGCMSYVHSCESIYYDKHGPVDYVIVNSKFQEQTIRPALEKWCKPNRVVRIPSCFWADEWRFCPRSGEGQRFYIGRLSRSANDKYSSSTWKIYDKIRKAVGGGRLHARVMAWTPDLERKLGRPPDWVECLPAKAESAEAFLHTLHAMVYRNGGAQENRPRVCMEAMACGTVVVGEDEFGWPELIKHGETGFLAADHGAFAKHTAALAKDDTLRMRIAQQARDYLPTLIDAPAIGKQWQDIFTAGSKI
jgi:glycosyltransferase involved in cell wall biosynthesis